MMGEYTAIPFHLLTAFESTQPPPLKTRQFNILIKIKEGMYYSSLGHGLQPSRSHLLMHMAQMTGSQP